MKKINNKGFSLIELLAVVAILGIIMIIAIPTISRVISNSKKEAYLDEVRMQVRSIEELISQDQYYVYDKSTVYYFDYKLGNEEKIGKSSYADWKEAYVVVTFDGKKNKYYWTGVDKLGYTIELGKEVDKLNKGDIKNTKTLTISTTKTLSGKSKTKVYKSE